MLQTSLSEARFLSSIRKLHGKFEKDDLFLYLKMYSKHFGTSIEEAEARLTTPARRWLQSGSDKDLRKLLELLGRNECQSPAIWLSVLDDIYEEGGMSFKGQRKFSFERAISFVAAILGIVSSAPLLVGIAAPIVNLEWLPALTGFNNEWVNMLILVMALSIIVVIGAFRSPRLGRFLLATLPPLILLPSILVIENSAFDYLLDYIDRYRLVSSGHPDRFDPLQVLNSLWPVWFSCFWLGYLLPQIRRALLFYGVPIFIAVFAFLQSVSLTAMPGSRVLLSDEISARVALLMTLLFLAVYFPARMFSGPEIVRPTRRTSWLAEFRRSLGALTSSRLAGHGVPSSVALKVALLKFV